MTAPDPAREAIEREAEARVVAWLRSKQNEWQAIADENERLNPFDHNYAADTASVWQDAADAIELREHLEPDHG